MTQRKGYSYINQFVDLVTRKKIFVCQKKGIGSFNSFRGWLMEHGGDMQSGLQRKLLVRLTDFHVLSGCTR